LRIARSLEQPIQSTRNQPQHAWGVVDPIARSPLAGLEFGREFRPLISRSGLDPGRAGVTHHLRIVSNQRSRECVASVFGSRIGEDEAVVVVTTRSMMESDLPLPQIGHGQGREEAVNGGWCVYFPPMVLLAGWLPLG
jgi:hypothetical protein